MILKPAPISTSRFTYDKRNNRFIACASDLGPAPFGRVFDDACDEGLTLVSARTGHEVVFVVQHEGRNADGELTYWELSPAAPADRACGDIVLYND